MKYLVAHSGRILVTAAMVLCAVVLGRAMWGYYMEAPWTRDGHLSADVVSIAPDVSGLVSEVLVKDNAEVKAGDVLFKIDEQRFKLALRQSEARVDSAQAALSVAKQNEDRLKKLTENSFSSQQALDEAVSTTLQSKAALDLAIAERDLAKLNVERSSIRASVPGKVTNFSVRPGDYAAAGKTVAGLVDSASFYVSGYFEETKLPRIHVGDPVKILFMGENRPAYGHVESVSGGIQDSERNETSGALPSVNPTFSWVRLAQRVPVRIALDKVPDGMTLVVGRTATVDVRSGEQARPEQKN